MNGCDGDDTVCDETECEQMFETPGASKLLRINKICNIGFRGNDTKVGKKRVSHRTISNKAIFSQVFCKNFVGRQIQLFLRG